MLCLAPWDLLFLNVHEHWAYLCDGAVSEGQGRRALAWKLLFNYLPADRTTWKDYLHRQRESYRQLLGKANTYSFTFEFIHRLLDKGLDSVSRMMFIAVALQCLLGSGVAEGGQGWPLLVSWGWSQSSLTTNISSCLLFVEKLMVPSKKEIVIFSSFQQLLCLGLGSLKRFMSCHSSLQGP